MKINYNISAMISNHALQQNDTALSKSIERLSTGLKINHARENASGLAMAKRMNAQIKSLGVANQNSNDGVSVIEIAEGALTEIEEMIQRMNELAVKASTGSISDSDREYIDDEIAQLKAEIERISATTMYNGEILLDGSFDVKGYTDNSNLKVTTYGDDVRSGKYTITSLVTAFDAEGNIDPDNTTVTLGPEFPADATVSYGKHSILVTGSNGFEMEFEVKGAINVTAPAQPINVDITGLGAMGIQTGTNEGQELGIRIATISLRTLGIDDMNCSTQDNALKFVETLNGTLDYINSARSRLGAYQNRLEHTINTLDISEENMTGAYSRIMDVDMASEMAEYAKDNVLVQASTSMLAQANERPSSVLQLLQ